MISHTYLKVIIIHSPTAFPSSSVWSSLNLNPKTFPDYDRKKRNLDDGPIGFELSSKNQVFSPLTESFVGAAPISFRGLS